MNLITNLNDDDNKTEWFTILSHPNYEINKDLQVRNIKTQFILSVSKAGTVALRSNDKKTSTLSINQLYLHTFKEINKRKDVLEGEIWKEHEQYPYIEISNYGHILRKSVRSISKGTIAKDGRCQIRIQNKEGETKNISVHLLVAELFLPPPTGPEYRLKHKDSDLSNNHINNLEWELPKSKSITIPISSKVKIYQKDMNNKIIKEYESMNEAAKALNIPAASISKCCRGERNYSHRWKWSYVSFPDNNKNKATKNLPEENISKKQRVV